MVNLKAKAKILSEKTGMKLIDCMNAIETNDGDIIKSWKNLLPNDLNVPTDEDVEKWLKEQQLQKMSKRIYEVIHHQYSMEQCLECVIKADGDQAQALAYLLQMNGDK